MNDGSGPISGSGERDAAAAPLPPVGAVQRARGLARRSAGNLRSTIAVTLARAARRRADCAGIAWRPPLFAVACVIGVCFLVLDEAAVVYMRGLPSRFRLEAWHLSGIANGGWYIVPAVLVLLVSNLVDWSRFTGRRLLVLFNRTTLAAFVLIAVGGAQLAAGLLNTIIGRARPRHLAEYGPHAFDPFAFSASWTSFPSGHASVAGSVAGVAMLLWPRARWFVAPVAMAVAGLRAVVGVHYLADVVAGFALGLTVAVATAVVFTRLGYIFTAGETGWPRRKKSFRLLARRLRR